MSLDKAIQYGKEHRQPYRKSKAIDKTCRNHGSCSYCEQNRKHKFRDDSGEDMLNEFLNRGIQELFSENDSDLKIQKK